MMCRARFHGLTPWGPELAVISAGGCLAVGSDGTSSVPRPGLGG